MRTLARRAASEATGTALLVMAVVGSGIMAERLAGGNAALALLCNALATGAALVAILTAFSPLSGAHLNPLVTVVEAQGQRLPWREVTPLAGAQIAGGAAGALLANAMFALPLVTFSRRERLAPGILLSEGVATFGLFIVVFSVARHRPAAIPFVVGAYITGAYWFTASTSFANPAVTIARTLTDTFTGIRPGDAPAFIAAQALGAFCALLLLRWISQEET